MRRRFDVRRLLVLAATLTVVATGVFQASAGIYVGGATVVYKEAGNQTAVDEGAAACLVGTGTGIGGGCLPFGAGTAVEVIDALGIPTGTEHEVAFQVCIDNNADLKCTSGGASQTLPCHDEVFFSHSDDGLFFNPLGPLPGARSPGCPTGGWNGYVVFICQGVHTGQGPFPGTSGSPHAHPSTLGTIELTTGGSGFGDFCGGSRDVVVEKDYVLIG
ncbi:MAG TPA: hypothetical protein VGB64_13110 [Actinomycetota bacterium]